MGTVPIKRVVYSSLNIYFIIYLQAFLYYQCHIIFLVCPMFPTSIHNSYLYMLNKSTNLITTWITFCSQPVSGYMYDGLMAPCSIDRWHKYLLTNYPNGIKNVVLQETCILYSNNHCHVNLVLHKPKYQDPGYIWLHLLNKKKIILTYHEFHPVMN